jgi:hypothetical protein
MTINRPVDQSRINLLEPDEVQYWADKFDVSKERLSEAVRKVGHSVDAVRRELKARDLPSKRLPGWNTSKSTFRATCCP